MHVQVRCRCLNNEGLLIWHNSLIFDVCGFITHTAMWSWDNTTWGKTDGHQIPAG